VNHGTTRELDGFLENSCRYIYRRIFHAILLLYNIINGTIAVCDFIAVVKSYQLFHNLLFKKLYASVSLSNIKPT
jgi:hypothetical protein